MKNFWNYFIWFVASMFVVTGGAELMNKPDTLAAVFGLFIIAFWVWVTIKTKLLTTIRFENIFKKHNKNKKDNNNE